MSRYGDLLALAEDFEEVKSRTPRLRQVPSRRAAAASNSNPVAGGMGGSRSGGEKKARKRHNSDSSDESSEVMRMLLWDVFNCMLFALCSYISTKLEFLA